MQKTYLYVLALVAQAQELERVQPELEYEGVVVRATARQYEETHCTLDHRFHQLLLALHVLLILSLIVLLFNNIFFSRLNLDH
jgi:hypothetical protein